MKPPLLLLFILSVYSTMLHAQHVATSSSFDGYWAGQVSEIDGEDKLWLILKIEKGVAQKMVYNKETENFENRTYEKESSTLYGNNLSYVWHNKGGVWSETQAHLLSYLEKGGLWAILVRQVNNAEEDKDFPGLNNEWNLIYKGKLFHYANMKELRKLLEE